MAETCSHDRGRWGRRPAASCETSRPRRRCRTARTGCHAARSASIARPPRQRGPRFETLKAELGVPFPVPLLGTFLGKWGQIHLPEGNLWGEIC